MSTTDARTIEERERDEALARLAAAEARAEDATRERDNWIETARTYVKNTDYYRSLIDSALKDEPSAYIADDGTRSEDPLRAKLPEIVAARKSERDALASRLAEVEAKRCEPGVICPTCVRAEAAESRLARAEEALREIAHYGWYAKAARVARAALAEVK